MATVSLSDRLVVRDAKGSRDEIICNWPDLPAENTLTKVLRFSRELLPIPPLRIELEKNIPAESGLGGGSSNAAGLLRCIQRMFSLPERNFLEDVAFSVGADVPFFLVGGYAQAEHYGEVLTPLEDLPQRNILIVRPDVGVSTQMAYQALDSNPREMAGYPREPFDLYNDFERVAPCECLELIDEMRGWGAEASGLSGSGSAVFGLFPDAYSRDQSLETARTKYACCFPCQFLSREESLWMT